MADPFASDYSPRMLWRLQCSEHVMKARLIPHAQHISVVILVDGRGRSAKQFEHQTDALRRAEEQRVVQMRGAGRNCPFLVSMQSQNC